MESGINTWSGKWDKHGGGHTQYTGSGKWDIYGVESGVQSEGKTVGHTLRVRYRRSGKWNTHGGRISGIRNIQSGIHISSGKWDIQSEEHK